MPGTAGSPSPPLPRPWEGARAPLTGQLAGLSSCPGVRPGNRPPPSRNAGRSSRVRTRAEGGGKGAARDAERREPEQRCLPWLPQGPAASPQRTLLPRAHFTGEDTGLREAQRLARGHTAARLPVTATHTNYPVHRGSRGDAVPGLFQPLGAPTPRLHHLDLCCRPLPPTADTASLSVSPPRS